MTRRTRGHAMALMLAVMAALGIVGGLTAQRVQQATAAKVREHARVQLLWLARSAVRHTPPGTRQVPALGGVRIEVERRGEETIARARAEAGVATVALRSAAAGQPGAWSETYRAR